MAYYVYRAGNPDSMQAEAVELHARDDRGDIERGREQYRERLRLLGKGMDAVARGEMRTSEVTQQLAKADPLRLPAELMSRLLDPEHYDTPILHPESGLAMYAPRTEGKPHFMLISEGVEDAEGLVADGMMDRDTFEHLGGGQEKINHRVVETQEVVTHDGVELRLHDSFGHVGAGGTYYPIVTVLSDEYIAAREAATS